jgi:NAD(P)-dependent dehydrogenase (short-subunit alcohol dehydrogenase family)
LFDLRGKTALVTGGARGVGEMIAGGLARAGVQVYLTSRDAELAAKTAAALRVDGDVHALPTADLGTSDGCRRLADDLAERADELHILVNNAGTGGVHAPLADFPDEGWDRVLDINLRSVFALTRAVLPLLGAAGSVDDPARVINIGSLYGSKVPKYQNFSYSASKAAVHMLTRHLAAELAPAITVNAIAPGMFPSRLTEPIIAKHGERAYARVPMRRMGLPDDIAGVTVFLASRASSFITGALIPLDGGVSTIV